MERTETMSVPPSGNSDRTQLHFREEAEVAFRFLERDYGFRLVENDETSLRYESPEGVFVNVYHGRSSYELKFEVGRLDSAATDERFYPVDFVELSGVSEESFFQASNAERVRRYLPELARVLAEHGSSALRGDPFVFKRLRDIQASRSDSLLLSWKLADARAEADAAWRDKNYSRVVQAYEPLKEHLMPSERKKLDYAKSHSALGNN
jgi:hypothetical protein